MAYEGRPHLRHTRNRPLRMVFSDNPSANFSVSPSSDSKVTHKPDDTGASSNQSDIAQLENIKAITEKAKACNVDPQLLLLAEFMAKSHTPTVTPVVTPATYPQPSHQRYDINAKQIGIMQEGEDIFAVLNRFLYSLKVNNIPQNEHLRALPAVLTGQFKDAYYNNIEGCHSYTQMREILLAVGGYTVNDCLNSFPLKYRPGGSTSVTQWFNMWTYKFSVMLNGIPFLDNLSEAAIDNIAKIFAATSVAAGLPNDMVTM